MGELYNPFPKLPKNIRQIGERDQTVRLYLEDYVNTYLKRLYPKGGQDLRVGVLLGTSEEHDGTPYLFVDGALEMEDVTEDGGKVSLTESAWKKTYQNMEQMFPKRAILGWFLCGAPGAALSPLNYWKQHGQHFAGKNQLMYLNSGLEGEEAVYMTAEEGFYKLRGYSIYYERNQMMQDYMILRKDARRVESGTGDPVIRDFRQRMEDNRSQVTARRGTIRVLGSLCSVLAITVLAGGVVMMNNYRKMKDMESVLTSVLPGGIITQEEKGAEGDELWVEEAAGNVYPTVAHETMSDTYPGESEAGEYGTAQISPGGMNQTGGGNGTSSAAGTGNTAGTGNASGTGSAAGIGNASGTGNAAGTGNTAGRGSVAGTDGAAGTDSAAGTGGAAGENGTGTGNSASGTGAGLKDENETGSISPESKQVLAGSSFYKVQDGETLYGICLKLYGTGSMMDEICQLNGLEDENKIISGQNLILP